MRSWVTNVGRRCSTMRAIDHRPGVRVGRRPEANRSRSLVIEQLRTVEDVDVLVDELADPHHHVVAGQGNRFVAAAQERVGFFDDALRDGGRAGGFGL